MKFREWMNELVMTRPVTASSPTTNLNATATQPDGSQIQVVMVHTPATRTTRQWAYQTGIDWSAANAPKDSRTSPMSYYDIIPSQEQQQADFMEFPLPVEVRAAGIEDPASAAAKKVALNVVLEIDKVREFLQNKQLDPQDILIHFTDTVDEKYNLPLYHVRFPIRPPNSVRLPNKRTGQWFVGGIGSR